MVERKSPGLEALLDALSTDIAQPEGMSRSTALEKRQCAMCGKDAKVFRDDVSTREYLLTAWCQACQDEFYG